MNQNHIVYFVLAVLVIIIGLFSTKVEKSYPDFIHNLSDEPLYKFIALCPLCKPNTISRAFATTKL